ncbi:MAG: 2-oxo acid dehydrogenase subunit E2 [Chloroflexota bacterium]|nr:2-oxo acid dehydrogenase subunit E2 [Chloroflexota bacterium]
MAVEIVMPKLGWTMEEGILVEWIKQDGDVVQPGDILFTVESDKALNEVESFEAGILRIPPDSDVLGTPLPVGTLLAYIVQPGESPPFESGTMTAPLEKRGDASAHPLATPAPSEPESRTRPHAATNDELPTISPRARRAAAELGVEWELLTGSGRTGRIVERDVRAAAKASSTPTVREELAASIAQAPESSIERTSTSIQPSTTISVTTEADVTELVNLHRRIQTNMQNHKGPVPLYDDLLLKLVTEALKHYSQLNARLEDGTFTVMHLGMYDIDAFTPALTVARSVILGVGRVVAKQVVVDAEREQVAIRQMTFLSLTCDSEWVDVESAARFLQRVKHCVEQPYLWLVR